MLQTLLLVALAALLPSASRNNEDMIGHMVYFQLNESTPKTKQQLVDACKKYLSKHEGTVFFAAGVLAEKLDREVNDRDWDVALHIVFKNMAAHNKYQEHPRHLKFIAENKDNWKKVRVFDSKLTIVEPK